MPDNQSTSLERIAHAVSEQLAGRRDQPATGQDLYNMSVMIDGNFSHVMSSMNGLEQRLNARIDRLEARMDRLEMRMDQLEARFDSFKLELENMFNRKMVQFLYMQIGISLALFSAMFTALYFSLGALVSAG
jgi:hypothetical protein